MPTETPTVRLSGLDPEAAAITRSAGYLRGSAAFPLGTSSVTLGMFLAAAVLGATPARDEGPTWRWKSRLRLRKLFRHQRDVRIPRTEKCSRCDSGGAEPGTKPVTCPTCNGTGQVRTTRNTMLSQFMTVTPCAKCGGTGKYIEALQKVRWNRGSQKKQDRYCKIAWRGLQASAKVVWTGNAGIRGGSPGDLYVVVFVKSHSIFQRQGDDLILDRAVSFTLAAIGGKTTIRTLEGDVQLEVPSGTQPNAVLRLRGKGMPRLRGKGRGDILVRVNVRVPTKLTAKEREALKDLGKLDGETFNDTRSFFQRLKGAGDQGGQ